MAQKDVKIGENTYTGIQTIQLNDTSGTTGSYVHYVETSDATAAATDILSGKTAYVNGELVEGSIQTRTIPGTPTTGSVPTTQTVLPACSGAYRYYVFSAGYYDTQCYQIPNIVWGTTYPGSSANAIATLDGVSKTTRYIYFGDSSTISLQWYYTISPTTYTTMPTSTSSTASYTVKSSFTPSTTDVYLNIATGYNDTDITYTIKGDSNLLASNIKKDTTIFGVTGTYEGGGESQTLPTSTTTTVPSGVSLISTFAVSTLNDRYLTIPAGNYATGGYYKISKQTTSSWPKTTSSTASYTVQNTITPASTSSYLNFTSGYRAAGSYCISGDANLIASNIKSGVSIFGVAGTYGTNSYGNASYEPNGSLPYLSASFNITEMQKSQMSPTVGSSYAAESYCGILPITLYLKNVSTSNVTKCFALGLYPSSGGTNEYLYCCLLQKDASMSTSSCTYYKPMFILGYWECTFDSYLSTVVTPSTSSTISFNTIDVDFNNYLWGIDCDITNSLLSSILTSLGLTWKTNDIDKGSSGGDDFVLLTSSGTYTTSMWFAKVSSEYRSYAALPDWEMSSSEDVYVRYNASSSETPTTFDPSMCSFSESMSNTIMSLVKNGTPISDPTLGLMSGSTFSYRDYYSGTSYTTGGYSSSVGEHYWCSEMTYTDLSM